MLLILSGDIETNPGPGREKKPDPKKVMEEKVNTHDEKIEGLEKTVSEQKKKIKEMTEKQVDLERALEDQKVELTKSFEDKKVVDSTLNEIKAALNDGKKKQKESDDEIASLKKELDAIKSQLSGSLSKLGSSTQDTSSKMKGMENALEDLQDKLYELDKSWENNLVFYGINTIKDEEERPQLLENKVREILRINLGLTRDVPVLRMKRAATGTNIRGSKPVTVYFQNYSDKEEILRKTQFLSGSNIYIAEDFSKKVRDKRTELRKFMKQQKKRSPTSKMSLRYDKLMIDKDVYTYNEVAGIVELQTPANEEGGRVSPTSQPNTPHHARTRVRSKSSGRRKKLEKAFSTESALNYIGDDIELTRSPSPTKSPFPDISEVHDGVEINDNQDAGAEVKSRPESAEPAEQVNGGAETTADGSNGVVNG